MCLCKEVWAPLLILVAGVVVGRLWATTGFKTSQRTWAHTCVYLCTLPEVAGKTLNKGTPVPQSAP